MKALTITCLTSVLLLSACGLDPGVLIGKQDDNREPIVQKWQVCREKAVTLQSRSGSYSCNAPDDLKQMVDYASSGTNKVTLHLNKIDENNFPELTRLNFSASRYDSSYSGYSNYTVRAECKEVTTSNHTHRVYECTPPASSNGARYFVDEFELRNTSCGSAAVFKATFPHPVCESDDTGYPSLDTVYIGTMGLGAVYATSR